jgi:heme exporter protein D
MHWNSLEEFLAMGGYAFFVWSSLGVTLIAMMLEVWILQSQRKQLKLPRSTVSQDHGNV